ncbi:MAG: hypothetical protein HQM08_18710 [Candidatus Riflebacteria bacterium]|nr:hypothetical protein [Candidatus Riflebacteria bacterium]
MKSFYFFVLLGVFFSTPVLNAQTNIYSFLNPPSSTAKIAYEASPSADLTASSTVETSEKIASRTPTNDLSSGVSTISPKEINSTDTALLIKALLKALENPKDIASRSQVASISSDVESLTSPDDNSSLASAPLITEPPETQTPEEIISILEKVTVNALNGYNSKNYKLFYSDFSDSMKANSNEYFFKTTFVENYFPIFGKLVSKTVNKDRSVLVGDFPMLVYSCAFEKVKGSVMFNFSLDENHKFKIMNISFSQE